MDELLIEELDADECWRHLAATRVGRLAVSVANRPDIFPVNYVVDDGTLVVQSAPGFKLAAATLGQGVAFEIDAVDEDTRTGWSVVVHGAATEVESIEDLLAADDLAIRPWAGGQKYHYLRIVPDEVTGRRIPPRD